MLDHSQRRLATFVLRGNPVLQLESESCEQPLGVEIVLCYVEEHDVVGTYRAHSSRGLFNECQPDALTASIGSRRYFRQVRMVLFPLNNRET